MSPATQGGGRTDRNKSWIMWLVVIRSLATLVLFMENTELLVEAFRSMTTHHHRHHRSDHGGWLVLFSRSLARRSESSLRTHTNAEESSVEMEALPFTWPTPDTSWRDDEILLLPAAARAPPGDNVPVLLEPGRSRNEIMVTPTLLPSNHSTHPRNSWVLSNGTAESEPTLTTAATSSSWLSSSSSSLLPPPPPSKSWWWGMLSKSHQSIIQQTMDRQRFVTGRYPLQIHLYENPTRQWLSRGRTAALGGAANVVGATEIWINGTRLHQSTASCDRWDWLDEDERHDLLHHHSMVSMELVAEIHTERPGYLHWWPPDTTGEEVSPRYGQEPSPDPTSSERLWVTGFALLGRRGMIKSVDCQSGDMRSVLPTTSRRIVWPNEVDRVPHTLYHTGGRQSLDHAPKVAGDALLVSDGFLVPGKDRGGVYVVQHPGDAQQERTVCLTDVEDGWFYHRAVFLDLTGDGRQSILSARCQVSFKGNTDEEDDKRLGQAYYQAASFISSGLIKKGQLVWLECPLPARCDAATGLPLEEDGTVFDPFGPRHVPWKTRVLTNGPDVMFVVGDMDPDDGRIEVLSSQFFEKRVQIHSIQIGDEPQVVFERTIDDEIGAPAFGAVLADLDMSPWPDQGRPDEASQNSRVIHNPGGAVSGERFSHMLVTTHEDQENQGGSVFAYRVPPGKEAWKTEAWLKSTVASGFKVRGQLNNMINPGAPGFVYTFHIKKEDAESRTKRPLIAVAGDCAGSAYLFRPSSIDMQNDSLQTVDASTVYQPMVEVCCGSTVGSLAIGYGDLFSDDQSQGYAKLFIPCYEKDKILVFSFGSAEYCESDW